MVAEYLKYHMIALMIGYVLDLIIGDPHGIKSIAKKEIRSKKRILIRDSIVCHRYHYHSHVNHSGNSRVISDTSLSGDGSGSNTHLLSFSCKMSSKREHEDI